MINCKYEPSNIHHDNISQLLINLKLQSITQSTSKTKQTNLCQGTRRGFTQTYIHWWLFLYNKARLYIRNDKNFTPASENCIQCTATGCMQSSFDDTTHQVKCSSCLRTSNLPNAPSFVTTNNTTCCSTISTIYKVCLSWTTISHQLEIYKNNLQMLQKAKVSKANKMADSCKLRVNCHSTCPSSWKMTET